MSEATLLGTVEATGTQEQLAQSLSNGVELRTHGEGSAAGNPRLQTADASSNTTRSSRNLCVLHPMRCRTILGRASPHAVHLFSCLKSIGDSGLPEYAVGIAPLGPQ